MTVGIDIDKTPDAYVENHGVEVEKEERYPQHGQVALRFNHNTFQSTRLQMGLAQAEELYEKLGQTIATIKQGA